MRVFPKIPGWLSIALLTLFTFFCIAFFFQKVAKSYVETVLKSQIKENIPKGYRLKYQKLEFDLTRKQLALNNFKLLPQKNNKENRTLQLDVPYLSLKIGSFWDPILRQTLTIRKVELDGANIKVTDLKSPKNKTLSEQSSSVLDTLEHYLHQLKIRDLEIQSTQLTYEDRRTFSPRSFHVEHLDLNIVGFSIDSSLEKHGFLNSRHVEAYISGEDLTLPDGKHHFKFESCRLSTRRKTLEFHQVDVKPRDSLELEEMAKEGGYLIAEIPVLAFEGIDFRKPYLDTILQMEVLRLKAPNIIYQRQKQTPESIDQENVGQTAIRRSIKQLSPSIKIGKIILDEASIDLDFSPVKAKDVVFDIDSIIVYKFEANEETILFNEDYLPFEAIDISISNIYQRLSPKIGDVSIDHARLNSGTASIELQNIIIGDSTRRGFQQMIPNLTLLGIDIFEIINKKKVDVKEISIFNPVSFIPERKSKSPTLNKTKDIFQSIDDFFTSFFINEFKAEQFNIYDGSIQYGDQLSVGNYDYQGRAIQLDTNANTWTEIVPRFNLLAKNITGKMEGKGAYSLQSLTRSFQSTSFKGLSIAFDQEGNHLDLSIPQGRFHQLKVERLLDGIVKADSLILSHPDFELQQKKKKAKPIATANPSLEININNIFIKQAKTQLKLASGDSLKIGKWTLLGAWNSIPSLKQLDLLQVKLNGPNLPFAIDVQAVHQLPGKHNFSMQNLKLVPLDGRIQQDSIFKIASLDIMGLDPDFIHKEKGFKAQRVHLDESSGFLRLPERKPFKSNEKVSSNFPVILDTLIWANTSLKGHRSSDALNGSIPNIDLELFGLNTTLMDSAGSWYKHFSLDLNKGIYLDNESFTLALGPLQVKSDHADFFLEEIQYYNKQAGVLKSLQLKGLQLEMAKLLAGELDLGDLSIASGQLNIEPEAKKESSNPSGMKIPNFEAQSVHIQNLDLALPTQSNLSVKGLEIRTEKIKYDSNFSASKIDDYIESLFVHADQISLEVGEQNDYSINLGFEYDANQHLTVVEHFSMKPNFITDEFWKIAADNMSISSWPIQQLVTDEIRIPKINITQLSAQDFNDQNQEDSSLVKPLWAEQLKSIPKAFIIDTLAVTGALSYQALAQSKHDSLWVHFEAIQATVKHITNVSTEFDVPMSIEAQALMYGESPVEISADFDLSSPDGYFNLEGSIKDIPLKNLSFITAPQSFVQLDRGFSPALQFSFAANDHVSVGQLFFNYEKLKFRILDKENPAKQNFSTKLKSVLANQLVLSNNPNWTGKNKGLIYFERLKHKSIINFWVKSVISGIGDGAGLRNNTYRIRKSKYDLSRHHFEPIDL